MMWLVACSASPSQRGQSKREPVRLVADAGPTARVGGAPVMKTATPKPKPRPKPKPILDCPSDTKLVGGKPPAGHEAFCALDTGGRQGPYVAFHDDGSKALAGQYENGVRHGTWTQYAADGKKLGSYTITQGTGTILRWYRNGTKAEETPIKDDQREGVRKLYDTTGKLVTEEHYKQGLLHGKRISGDRAGLAVEERYRDGKLHGTRRIYFRHKKLLEEHYWRGVLTGPWRNARTWGEPRTSGKYRAGRKVGDWITYYRNGKIWVQAHYERGRLHGPYKELHWEDQVLVEGVYNKGRKDGEWKHFNAKGEELGTYTMKDGTGVALTWHEKTKKVETRTTYRRGRRHGRFRRYTRWGRKTIDGYYWRGKRHGSWRQWHSNGRRKLLARYDKDQPTGTWKRWYRNGKLASVSTYKQGKLNGEWIEYFHSGSVESRGNYVNDKREGEWTFWYADGKVSMKSTWKDGVLHGSYSSYYPNGKLRAEGRYDRGKRAGEWRLFNEDGTPTKK